MLEAYIEIDSDLPNIGNKKEGKITKSIESECLDGRCFFYAGISVGVGFA